MGFERIRVPGAATCSCSAATAAVSCATLPGATGAGSWVAGTVEVVTVVWITGTWLGGISVLDTGPGVTVADGRVGGSGALGTGATWIPGAA